MIRLDDIAGYVSERNVWALIWFLAEEGLRNGLASVEAEDVIVMEDGFRLESEGRKPEGAADVGRIGAIAFYAVMGVEAIGDKACGSRAAVQRISSAHASHELSSLIHSCMNPDFRLRPDMDEVLKTAETALSKKSMPSQSIATNSGRTYGKSLVKFWPEEMAGLLIFIILTLLPVSSPAQNFPAGLSEQMKTLVMRCVAMRLPENADAVSREFRKDHSWTMLDEIAKDENECTIYDDVNELGINMICAPVLLSRQGVTNTGGTFVNGQDPRYDYSLIELTAKAGSVIDYEIEKRQGTQTFAVIPCETEAEFSVELEEDGACIADPVFEEGICYVRSMKKMMPEDKFRISIKNASGKNMSFVVINHNARD